MASQDNSAMETLNTQNRRIPRRVPLSDGSATANVLPAGHPLPSFKHQPVSAVADEEIGSSKCTSIASAASTNTSGAVRKRKTHIGPWQLGQTIGKGGTSRVRKVRHTITGEPAVAKIIPKAVADRNRSVSLANLVKCAERGEPSLAVGKAIPFGLEREIVIMKLLNHRNIVRLFDVWENRNELYLIMEYVEGGELFEYMAQQHHLNEREAIYLFRQIIAALLYCHRIHIHHRDLKPENILLNLNTFEVKLVDFGMAALQPEGGLLKAPCGSPHYAAPEVITSKAYDGSKADVWSCGVTLFMMLTGYPPFNLPYDPHNAIPEDKKLRALYRTICRADYNLPSTLSLEARDLITKVLVPRPKDRISIEQLWYHPLLHKYDGDFGLTEMTLEASIGPKPIIENWERLTIKTIDREIFRNLRTLWHSESEAVLVERLCSEEPNHEKYFYSALLKYREENLENMLYNPGVVQYSASDYQHIMPTNRPEKIPSISASKGSHPRFKSQYSVLNNEHLYSRHTFFDNFSEASYDPFRASKEPIVNATNNYVNVTVHRSVSNGSKKRNSCLSSGRKSSSIRVEAIRKPNRGGSGLSIASTLIRSPSLRISTSHRSSMSRTSIHSGQWLSSPPIAVIRPSHVHKRAVNFSHLRKNSTSSGPTSQAGSDRIAYTPDQRSHQRQARYRSGGSLTAPSFSSQNQVVPPVVSKKEVVLPVQPTPRTKMKDIENEARKVSVELEKVCEEAFFRSSISSSMRSSTIDKPSPFCDTPPSSVSNQSRQVDYKLQSTDRPTLVDRPLPPIPLSTASSPPAETPRTFTARELARVQDRLARTYAEQGVSSEKAFHDVLNQLDNLLPFEPRRSVDGTRSSSAPYHSHLSSQHSPDTNNLLHAIPEEGCFADAEVEISQYERKSTPRRVATAPLSGRYDLPTVSANNSTVRLVLPSSPPSLPSPTPVAPLNIRKRSDNNNTIYNAISGNDVGAAFQDQIKSTTYVHPSSRPLWRNRDGRIQPKKEKVDPRRVLSDLGDRYPRRKEKYECGQRELEGQQRGQTANSPSLEQVAIESEQIKRGFFSFFKRKPTPTHIYELKDESRGIDRDTHGNNEVPIDLPSDTCELSEPRNLLARIFHFKPEVKTLALRVRREEVMHWLFHLLQAHSDKGLKDIQRSQVTANEFSVTVDKKNYYGIKPCKFVVEGFQILTDGKDASLCVLRFTQTSGAASSMRKVIREITKAFKLKKTTWLVDDRREAKKICDCIKLA